MLTQNEQENNQIDIKKKMNSIMTASLPYLTVLSSTILCVMTFVGSSSQPISYIQSFNNTNVNSAIQQPNINTSNQVLSVVNFVCGLIISVYGNKIKKQLKEKEKQNETLSTELERITNDRGLGSITFEAFGQNEPTNSITPRSTTTNYPVINIV